MFARRSFCFSLALAFTLMCVSSPTSFGEQHFRGRKYKAPPPTAHIEVEVLRKDNGKPIMNAAVVFNPFDQKGKDLGNLEVKTGPDGKAVINIIPVGSTVDVQVIATGFSTFAQQYDIDTATKAISVSMLRPRAQVSAYTNNEGKASERKPGVQEPDWPNLKTSQAAPASGSAPSASGSGSSQNPDSSKSTTKQ